MLKTSAFVAAALAAAAPAAHAKAPMNAINVIAPYKLHGTWMFDDAAKGLHQEAFVSGADTWMDRVTAHIPNAQRGFALVFSKEPFPGHQFQLERRHADAGGRWYWSPELKMEGWLCSALFRYFDAAPEHIYAQVKPIPGKSG